MSEEKNIMKFLKERDLKEDYLAWKKEQKQKRVKRDS